VDADGDSEVVKATVGETLLEAAHNNDIEIEGACGGECACSTCHVVLPQALFDSLDEPEEEEEDMLDLALGLKDTSRLGCQVTVTEAFEGAEIMLPSEVNNMQG
jgi:ferredoxin